jgi:small GTP-binding protein
VIQKKICMVGVHGTGKTSLVQQYVFSMFSEKYHSTVGVKIDRKRLEVDGTWVNMVLWDLAGRDGFEDVNMSYLRGASGILYVVDGTRRETFDQIFELREMSTGAVGDVASLVALNKSDLTEQWLLEDSDIARLGEEGMSHFVTSARTGAGVEDAFMQLAKSTLS